MSRVETWVLGCVVGTMAACLAGDAARDGDAHVAVSHHSPLHGSMNAQPERGIQTPRALEHRAAVESMLSPEALSSSVELDGDADDEASSVPSPTTTPYNRCRRCAHRSSLKSDR